MYEKLMEFRSQESEKPGVYKPLDLVANLWQLKVKSSDIDFGADWGNTNRRLLFSASTEAKLTNGCYNPGDFFGLARNVADSLTANSLDADHQRRLTETAMASKA